MIIFIVGFGSIFIYKIKNGFPVSYETEIPVIEFPKDKKAILLFTKSTGFRHSESIEASKTAIAALGDKNNWFVYETASSAVFNPVDINSGSTRLARYLLSIVANWLVIFNNLPIHRSDRLFVTDKYLVIHS